MPRWKVFYTDGSTFDDRDGGPEDAPGYGVQVILNEHPNVGRRVLKLVDHYLWSPTLGQWTDHVDAASVILRASREPWVSLLCGEYIGEDAFQAILIRAQNDEYLPPKPGG